MSRSGAVVIAAVAMIHFGGAAWAEEVDADDPDDAEEPKLIEGSTLAPVPGESSEPDAVAEIKDHFHQFGLAIQIPVGVRAVAPYDGEWCGDRGENGSSNAEVCVNRQPATFDFELAYGLKRNFELMLELRVGIERDFAASASASGGPRLFHWSPGVKFYFSQAKISKLFSTAQIAFDHTGYAGEAGTDFFVRNVNGLQLDLDQSYGVYFFIGEEFAFRRWLSLAVEAGVGFQGRYP
jgi:hypothetical protein